MNLNQRSGGRRSISLGLLYHLIVVISCIIMTKNMTILTLLKEIYVKIQSFLHFLSSMIFDSLLLQLIDRKSKK